MGDHSPEEFIKGAEKSIPRNPLIADTSYYAKDIERWGSGFKRIVDECKAAGVKVTFENIKTGFVVTFYRPKAEITPLNAGISEEVKLLVDYIRNNPGQRVPAISKAINIAPKTLERWLKQLKGEGKIILKEAQKLADITLSKDFACRLKLGLSGLSQCLLLQSVPLAGYCSHREA